MAATYPCAIDEPLVLPPPPGVTLVASVRPSPAAALALLATAAGDVGLARPTRPVHPSFSAAATVATAGLLPVMNTATIRLCEPLKLTARRVKG